jgi:glycosyltransferase involved in cell wall biosynthesis
MREKPLFPTGCAGEKHRMRIVVAHPSLNKLGGAERVCLTAIGALRRHGHRVSLFTIDRTNWPVLRRILGEIPRPDEERCLLETLPVRSSLLQAILTLSLFILELLKLETRGKQDILMNTSGDTVDSIADITYVNALPLRMIYHYPDSSSAIWRILSQGYDLFLRVADQIYKGNILITNSKFLSEIVKEYSKRESTVIYPPADTSKFMQAQKSIRRHKALVVSASRLRTGKRLETIPRIAQLTKKAHFIILGAADNSSQRTLREITNATKILGVSDRVDVLINQPFGRFADIISSAKVFLSTQPTESFGIAVVEAMATGCVPVVPRSGGPWCDILQREQGKYGYSYRSAEEAARIIDMLMENDSLTLEVSNRAAKRAKEFDIFLFNREILSVVQTMNKGHLRHK